MAIWDFDRQMTAYRFKYTSHAQEAAVVKRGYLVRLGKGAELGTLMPQPIQQRVQWETKDANPTKHCVLQRAEPRHRTPANIRDDRRISRAQIDR